MQNLKIEVEHLEGQLERAARTLKSEREKLSSLADEGDIDLVINDIWVTCQLAYDDVGFVMDVIDEVVRGRKENG